MGRTLLLLLLFSFGLQAQEEPIALDTTLIQFKKSDLLISIQTDSVDLKKLIGNVILQQGQTTFSCDSAYLFFETNSMEAFGRVHIEEGDSIDVYGDRMLYDGNSRLAYIFEKVRLDDQKTRITGDTLVYSLNGKRALLHRGITVRDSENRITADSLEYFTSSKNAHLYGDVIFSNGGMKILSDTMEYNMLSQKGSFRGGGQVKNKGTVIDSDEAYYDGRTGKVIFSEDVTIEDPQYNFESDSLNYDQESGRAVFGARTTISNDSTTIIGNSGWYDKSAEEFSIWDEASFVRGSSIVDADSMYFDNATGIGRAYSNVLWTDTVNNFIMESQFSEYRQDGGGFMATENPLLKIVMGARDTLYMRADTLRTSQSTDSLGNDVLDAFNAFYSVAMFSKDFQGVCDSMQYSFVDSSFQFYENPILWFGEAQLSADSIRLVTVNRQAEKIELKRNALIVSAEAEGIHQQLKGVYIDGFFTENDLDQLKVREKARSIYFAKNDEGAFLGANDASAANMVIWMKENQVQRIKFLDDPAAVYSPIALLDPYKLKVNGFFWEEDSRPMSIEDLRLVRLVKRPSRSLSPDEVSIQNSQGGGTPKGDSSDANKGKNTFKGKGGGGKKN